MEMVFQVLLTAVIGIAAGFLGAIAGGGGLISIPFLLLLGLPTQVAIGTNKLGAVGLSLSAIYRYHRDKKIIWKYTAPLTLLALFGGVVGAQLLLEMSHGVVDIAVGVLMLALLPTLFLGDGVGLSRASVSWRKKVFGMLMYLILMLLGGFFGGSIGALTIYILIFSLGLPFIEANATDFIPWFFMSLSSLIVYAANGVVEYHIGVALFIGMLVGGYIGARTAVRKGNAWVRGVFIFVVIVSSLKLFFG